VEERRFSAAFEGRGNGSEFRRDVTSAARIRSKNPFASIATRSHPKLWVPIPSAPLKAACSRRVSTTRIAL
jgi:hypothetical protein